VDDTTRDNIRQHIDTYNKTLATVRADKNLSELGRRNAVKAAYEDAQAKVRALRAKVDADQATRRHNLERRLFGLDPLAGPSDVISFRDAQDRVSRAKSADELGELMEQAHASGDKTLLKAAFAMANRRSRGALGADDWAGLVEEYVAEHPSAAGDLAEYRAMNSTDSLTVSFAERLATSVSRPAELQDRRVLAEQDGAA